MSTPVVLLDSGCIVALFDRSERYHGQCLEAVRELPNPIVTCEAVISESCFLLRKMNGAPDRLLENVESGVFQIGFDLQFDAHRVRTLMKRYAKVPMSFADACLVCLAEDFNTSQILTLDTDFHVYRINKRKAFELLIDLT